VVALLFDRLFYFIMARRKTTEEFINQAKQVHGDKYDYSLVEYVNTNTKVGIICKNNNHGTFYQRASAHLFVQKCHKCTGNAKSNTQEFINKSIKKHGNKYDYSLVEYKGNHYKVKIICPIHTMFEQEANSHLLGNGCPMCGKILANKKTSLTITQFIKRAMIKHGNRYNYDKVVYVNSTIKVTINCKEHGDFECTPSNHIQGKGCSLCGNKKISEKMSKNPTGWNITNWEEKAKSSRHFDSFKVYIIRCWNDNEEFYKIGRMFTTTKHRFRAKSIMPYNYEVVEEIVFGNAKDAFNKETELKRINRKSKKLPSIKFNGSQECFSFVYYH